MDEKLKMINALLSLETDDEVLPLEYDDSLSLYEFFAKFVHYISKMIDDNTILEHLENKRNPHGVTLEQLGVTAGTSDDVNKVIDMQVANTVYMAPNGYIGKPEFRRLDENDLPSSITGPIKFLDGVTGYVQNQINDVNIKANNIQRQANDTSMELSNAVDGFGSHIGNRSNPHGVTIAQIGAAPSGYGYGGSAIRLGATILRSEAELDELIESVYSEMGSGETKLVRFVGYPDTSDFSWFGLLTKSSNNYGSMFAHSSYNYGKMISKVKVGGTWYPLEWYNPPMSLGVEYRTTERWNGKVVYAKAVNFGELPNASTKNVLFYSTDPGVTAVVSLIASLSDGNILHAGMGKDRTHSIDGDVWLDCTRFNVRIYTNSDFSSITAIVTVKYTKD